jgi:hypothetical protein
VAVSVPGPDQVEFRLYDDAGDLLERFVGEPGVPLGG